jgi:hypothetical protein
MPDEIKEVEEKVLRKCIEELLSHGFHLSIHNGEEQVNAPCREAGAIFSDLFSTDEERIFVYKPGSALPWAWIFLVHGNDGHDVICDYLIKIEPYIQETEDFARALELGAH